MISLLLGIINLRKFYFIFVIELCNSLLWAPSTSVCDFLLPPKDEVISAAFELQ